ncbi:MAG TPA: hypothetical protein EYQ25_09065 [Planctomycetes bacterium]|nr:hypothetical protein [Planctomycetota bacterium]HIL37099.1 hypothetical protein [Planctomycetota bacterium]
MTEASQAQGPETSTSQHKLAGALIWRQGAQGPQVALVEQDKRWTLPRVAVHQDEDRATIAGRLATQWTGRPATPMGFAGQARSKLDQHELSTWYFSFVVDTLGVAKQQPWLRWVTPGDAVARLDCPEEQALLKSTAVPQEVRNTQGLRDSSRPSAQALCATSLLVLAAFSNDNATALGQNLLLGALAANLTALVTAARIQRLTPAPAWITACAGASCAFLAHTLQATSGTVIALGVGISLLTMAWERDSQGA